MKIKAVIFDKDGVIVDSESLQFKAFRDTLAEYGFTFSFADNLAISVGKGGKTTYQLISKKYHISDIDEFKKKRRARYKELSEKYLRLRRGVKKIIQSLYKKYLLAVASGSSEKLLYYDLAKFNLQKYFKVIVSSEHLKDKPDPEIFLITACRLGVKPKECIVIEDAQAGVEAAKTAGMYCIAFPNQFTEHQDFSKADIVVKSLKEINWKTILRL